MEPNRQTLLLAQQIEISLEDFMAMMHSREKRQTIISVVEVEMIRFMVMREEKF
jgi:hypothetical protein